jgi:hypothetical protein
MGGQMGGIPLGYMANVLYPKKQGEDYSTKGHRQRQQNEPHRLATQSSSGALAVMSTVSRV